MKKMLFSFLLITFSILSIKTTAQSTNSKTTNAKKPISSLSGAWHSVDNKEFFMMYDGFYSSIAQDSTGKWSENYAGTYTIDNANTMTLKVTHSSFAYRIGYLHTIEYNLKGNSLIFKLYKKLIDPKAGDMTARMPKDQQIQYVRAKK